MSTTTTMHPVAQKFGDLRRELNSTFLERNDVILAMMLTVLTGQHIFLLGPPGTAKSLMVRTLVRNLLGARYFEILLHKGTSIEAIEGPLDIKRFRETGEYVLRREFYATQVEMLMLDEIGKANPAAVNGMLALLNERLFHEVRDGMSVHPAPLSSAFGASNETLTDQSDSTAALWDRFLVRVLVDYLVDDDNFAALVTSDMTEPTTTIDWGELRDVIDNVVPAVTLSEPALKGLVSLRHEFRRERINPSDRRWRQSVMVLQAHAFLNGRSEVVEDDLAVLRFVLWDTVEQIDKVTRMCMIAANPYVERLLEIKAGIAEVDAAITERVGPDANGNDQTQARRQYGKEANTKLSKVRDSLDALLLEAQGRPIPGFRAASDEHRRVLKRAYMVCLEQTDSEADVMMRDRLGQGDGGNE